MTSVPFVRRTLATLRMAEFGFFGVRVMTCTQTPRRKGLPCSAGALDFATTLRRPFLTSWLMVGMCLDGRLVKVEKARNLPEQRPPARTISRFMENTTLGGASSRNRGVSGASTVWLQRL